MCRLWQPLPSVVSGNTWFLNIVQVLCVRPARQICSAVDKNGARFKSFVPDIKIPSDKAVLERGEGVRLDNIVQCVSELRLPVYVQYGIAIDLGPD